MHNNKMGDFLVDSRKLRKLMVSSPESPCPYPRPSWVHSDMSLKKRDAIFTTQFDATNLSPSKPFSDFDSTPSSSGKISPAVVLIIVILAVVLFISGLIHLLIRSLIKHRSSSSSVSESNRYPELAGSGNVQRQLRQLFHLHDSGLDQAFIDALPVFLYQEIMGLKEPFDCAVCLCEFSEQDKLRLLPNCSHAFHIDCIDTWLLSNSTCPLCRGTLFADGICTETPIFVLEDSREEEDGFHEPMENDIMTGKRVFSVRLGKFKSSNESENGKGGEETSEVGETSSSNFDARRCFSMGSYQYVVADSDLQVALRPSQASGTSNGSASMRIVKEQGCGDSEGKRINFRSKGESFSVSKIWQWSRKGKAPSSSETHLANGGNNSCITVDSPWKH